MRWSEVVEGWASSDDARARTLASVRDVDAPAILWETSPSRTGAERFEQRLVAAPGLARIRANPAAFDAHLRDEVARFDNLGGDSRLMAPPVRGDFGHLLSFVRVADEALQHALLESVAAEIAQWWADQARGVLWVSTHGGGVPWLHVRLDPRPKYYRSALRQLTA